MTLLSRMPLPTSREDLLGERASLNVQMGKIGVILTKTVRKQDYQDLLQEKRAMGVRIQAIDAKLRELNREHHLSMAECFMQTTIRMFDGQDIAEIWDRVHAENPHLRDKR